MPKLKIFIGFASTNNDVARRIAKIIEDEGHAPTRWNELGLFNPGQYTYDRLMDLTREYDGAIFIFGCDDPVDFKGKTTQQPRDNVLIEFGLFSGVLGLEAVCFCRLGNSKIAIDLDGITYIDLDLDPMGRVSATAEETLSSWLSSLVTSKNKIQSMAKIRDLDSNFPLLQLYTPKDPQGKPGDAAIYALSDSCKQFFGYAADASDQLFFQMLAKPFLDKLENYISPPIQYWDDLTEDQSIVYQKLHEGKLPLARVPVCFNKHHPSFKNQSFVPIIVQKEQKDGGEVMTILYVETSQLPKCLLGDNVWRDISEGIDMSVLAAELAAMADKWEDVAKPRIDALKKASEEARRGGSMTVAAYLAEAGFYSCRKRAAEGKFETVTQLLSNLVPNLIP